MNDLSSPTDARSWWAGWFNETYADVYGHRDFESAVAEAGFACQALNLEPSMRILDLCCGFGRHTRALLDRGMASVQGMDYSAELLKRGRAQYTLEPLVRGDMRALPYVDHGFDAVLMFFTSFGYFQKDAENLGVLKEIARVLKSGGAYLIDYLNPARVRADLVPRSEKTTHGRRVIEKRWLTDDGRRVEKRITVEEGDRREVFLESVRLYECDEMIEMLTRAGLKPDTVYGDFNGVPWDETQPRSIFVRKFGG